MTTARIITGRCCAMPTAVMTLSSEKMMSKTAICTSVPLKLALPPLALCSCVSPVALEWISSVDLTSRNNPPPISTKSRPLKSRASTLNSGLVSPMIQLRLRSSSMRVNIASASPIIRARPRCASGKRPHKIAIKMILSMPSTISSPVSVARLIHASGEAIHSNIGFLWVKI